MGKHETGYARVERDLYPTPPWVVSALAEHVDLRGLTVWEPACGDGRMAEALRQQGCARVYTSDIVDRGTGQDEVLDFLSAQMPELARFDMSATNPPFGQGGRQATAFIEVGLRRLPVGAVLARCCCRATLIPPRRARAISTTARNSSARSCCGSVSSGSSAAMESAKHRKKTARGSYGSAAPSAFVASRCSCTPRLRNTLN
jgi:hypothetical protein